MSVVAGSLAAIAAALAAAADVGSDAPRRAFFWANRSAEFGEEFAALEPAFCTAPVAALLELVVELVLGVRF